MMRDAVETVQLKLTTVSPIHIQGAVVEYGLGLAKLQQKDTYAYVINQEKLNDFLVANGLCEQFASRFSADDANYEGEVLKGFLGRLWNRANLEKISSGIVPAMGKGNFIRDGRGRVIVPGSSIKGALRTAVAWYILDRMKRSNRAEFDKVVVAEVERKIAAFRAMPSGRRRDKLLDSFAEAIMT